MSMRSRTPGRVVGAAARLGQAAWFFGNLYEAVVGIPQLLADVRSDSERTGLLGTGSPVRYYALVAPVALAATPATLLTGLRSGADPRDVATVAAGTASAVALTAYLVRTVNLRLLTSAEPLDEHERRRLVATWHALNAVRLGALGVSMAGLSRLAANRPR